MTLRSTVGSTSIFVMIEVRERKSVSDQTWIEQIRSKREDVRADKAIAVSSKGFSQPARSAAARYGIELRTLAEIDRSEQLDWIGTDHFLSCVAAWRILEVSVTLRTMGDEASGKVFEQFSFEGGTETLPTDQQVLVNNADGRTASINDLLDRRFLTKKCLSLPLDTPERFRVTLDVRKDEDRTLLRTTEGLVEIASITLELELARRLGDPVPIARSYRYSADSGILAEGVEAVTPTTDGPVTVGLHRSADGKRLVAVVHRDRPRSATDSSQSPLSWYSIDDEDSAG